ncbi:MAG TPA: alpha/beta fold hydrolase [Acidimicrobiia bacterium]
MSTTARWTSRVAPGPVSAVAEWMWFRPRARRAGPRPSGAKPFELTVGKRDLGGYTLGTGEPVLLLHGWGGDASDLNPLAEAVASHGARAVVPELPGHGSDRGSRADLFAMTATVSAVGWMFGAPDVVVAHSFGAPVAFSAFAAGGPRHVMLIAPALRMDGYFDWFVARLGLSHGARRRFSGRIERFAGPQIMSIMRGEGVIPGADVLIVHDPADRTIAFADSERYAAAHPRTSLMPVGGAGHQEILGHPAVLDAVSRLLPI